MVEPAIEVVELALGEEGRWQLVVLGSGLGVTLLNSAHMLIDFQIIFQLKLLLLLHCNTLTGYGLRLG